MNEQKTCVWSILAIIFAFIFPLLGIVFGIIALIKIKDDPSLKGKGLAIAGIIIGIVWIPFLAIIATLTAFGVMSTDIFVPNRCTIEPIGVIDCVDYGITTDGKIYFNLENAGGKGDLKILEVVLTGGDLGDSECGGLINPNYIAPAGFAALTDNSYLDFPSHEKRVFFVGKTGTDLMFADPTATGCDILSEMVLGKKARANIKLVYFTGTDSTITHTLYGQLVAPIEKE